MLTYILFVLALTINLDAISPPIRSCMQSAIKSSVGILSILIARLVTHISSITINDKSISEGVITIEDSSIKSVILALNCISPASLWSTVIVLPRGDSILISIFYDLLGVKFVSITQPRSLISKKTLIITSIENTCWRGELYQELSGKVKFYSIINGKPRPFPMVETSAMAEPSAMADDE